MAIVYSGLSLRLMTGRPSSHGAMPWDLVKCALYCTPIRLVTSRWQSYTRDYDCTSGWTPRDCCDNCIASPCTAIMMDIKASVQMRCLESLGITDLAKRTR